MSAMEHTGRRLRGIVLLPYMMVVLLPKEVVTVTQEVTNVHRTQYHFPAVKVKVIMTQEPKIVTEDVTIQRENAIELFIGSKT